jgi:hypothetical protein
MLKAHFDTFNHTYSSKVQEADIKIAAFDTLHEQHEALLQNYDDTVKQRNYLEIKLKESSGMLGTVEENR